MEERLPAAEADIHVSRKKIRDLHSSPLDLDTGKTAVFSQRKPEPLQAGGRSRC